MLPACLPAGYKLLGLLHEGCAYQVRGDWRFRGSRRCVNKLRLVSLLAKSLVERVETDRHAQIRITVAGRKVAALDRVTLRMWRQTDMFSCCASRLPNP